MAVKKTYSLPKLFAFIAIFAAIGAASAASITVLIAKIPEIPISESESYPMFFVNTDEYVYHPKDNISIYLTNFYDKNITFNDDAYGLHLEKLVDGEWKFLLSLGNSSRQSLLEPILDSNGMYQPHTATVNYTPDENFAVGVYKAVSIGETSYNGTTISVNSEHDFRFENTPPPPGVLPLLEVTTDKTMYHQGEVINIRIVNKSNWTLSFRDGMYGMTLEKWNDTSWELYHASITITVITYLEPGKEATRCFESEYFEKPLVAGKYRAILTGEISDHGTTIQVEAYSEFMVE